MMTDKKPSRSDPATIFTDGGILFSNAASRLSDLDASVLMEFHCSWCQRRAVDGEAAVTAANLESRGICGGALNGCSGS